jgi:putative acetyltransferase
MKKNIRESLPENPLNINLSGKIDLIISVSLQNKMNIRQYSDTDWQEVEKIYNLSKPDEMRGSVDLQALIPFKEDSNAIKLFQDSEIIVMEENDKIIGFAGNKGNYISWLFVHPIIAGKKLQESYLIKY